MISHKYECVFVHIPKSAGTSIGTKLGLYEKESRSMQDHRPIKLLTPVDARFLTQAYKQEYAYALYRKVRDRILENRSFLTKEQYKRYFKFTFVRNPWARVHSWYKNILDDPIHMKTYKMPENSTLNWFVKNRLYTVDSQLDFIYGWDGEIALDFIGRYEHLYEDFAFVCQTLGIEDPSLPEKMRIGTPSYIPAYDQESIEIVAEAFKDEIDLFGFSFGDRIVEKTEKPYVVSTGQSAKQATSNGQVIVPASS